MNPSELTLATFSSHLWVLVHQFVGTDVPNQFDLRQFIELVNWIIIYNVIRIRAIKTLSQEHLVLMGGALVSIVNKISTIGIQYSKFGTNSIDAALAVYSPLGHFFELVTILCVCYYSLHVIHYWQKLIQSTKTLTGILALSVLVCSYVFIYDVPFFKFHGDYFTIPFHVVSSVYLFAAVLAYNLKFKNPFRGGLYIYLILNLGINVICTLTGNNMAHSTKMLIDFAHMLSIGFLLYHLIKLFTWKLNDQTV